MSVTSTRIRSALLMVAFSLLALGTSGVVADSDPPQEEPTAEPDWHDCWADGPHLPVADPEGHVYSIGPGEWHFLINPRSQPVDIFVRPLDGTPIQMFVVEPADCDVRRHDTCGLGSAPCLAPDLSRYEAAIIHANGIGFLDSWYVAYPEGSPLAGGLGFAE